MDGPATPVEKFFTLEDQYRRTGKAWDPELVKDVLIRGYKADYGWADDDARLVQLRRITSAPIEADPARVRREKLSEREVEKERQAAKARAAEEAARRAADASTPEDLAAENAKLRALLEGNQAAEPAPEPIDPNEEEDLPSEEQMVLEEMAKRSRKQILEWADTQGVDVPPELTNPGKTKMALVEYVLEQLDVPPKEE